MYIFKPIDKINTPTKSYVEQLHDYLYFHTQVYTQTLI